MQVFFMQGGIHWGFYDALEVSTCCKSVSWGYKESLLDNEGEFQQDHQRDFPEWHVKHSIMFTRPYKVTNLGNMTVDKTDIKNIEET